MPNAVEVPKQQASLPQTQEAKLNQELKRLKDELETERQTNAEFKIQLAKQVKETT